jgi:hypothetical protein
LATADRALLLIYDRTLMPGFHFYFGKMTVSNGLITFCPLCDSSFSGTQWISKSFKLPTFWLLDFASGLHMLLKWKGTFSWETNHHIVACYAYKVSAAEHISSHRFSLLPSVTPRVSKPHDYANHMFMRLSVDQIRNLESI